MFSAPVVAGPIPHTFSTGNGCKKAITSPGSTRNNPLGLARLDDIFAISLVGAMPTEHGMPCSSATSARISSPTCSGSPSSRRVPVMSRKPSSSDTFSTCGVMVAKIANTPSEAAS